jgi:hypothetical protein
MLMEKVLSKVNAMRRNEFAELAGPASLAISVPIGLTVSVDSW